MTCEIPSEPGDEPKPAQGDAADLTALPWSHIVVAEKDDAESSGKLVPTLKVIGLNDSRLTTELPTGSGSCVLAMGQDAMRAAGELRGFGIERVFGTHMPPGCRFLCQFLEQRAAAVDYFGGGHHLHEVLDAWTGSALLLDVTPVEHPDLPRPPRLKGRPFQELLGLPTPRTLIGGCLAEQAIVVLGGASKTWKSFLVLDWHLSLYWGLVWRGRRVRPGSSLYFCGEGQAYAGRRVKAWLQHNAERIRDIDTAGRVLEIVGEVPRLTKPEGIAELRACLRDFVRRHGPVSMVTLDTLSVGLSGDDDENSNAMMGAIVAELGRIRTEFGCTVVLVHHLRKDAVDASGHISMNALRGGVALPCNTDQVFLVSIKDGEQTLTLDKNKDGEDGIAVAISTFQVLPLGTDDEGLPITSGVLLPVVRDLDAAQAARLNQLLEHYRQTFKDAEFTQSLAEQMKPSSWGRQEVRDTLAIARETRRIEWRLEGKTVLHGVPGGAP